MQCSNQIVHTIRPGDTLFSLANRFDTTVTSIMNLNPGIEVYNLQIGSTIKICPGPEFVSPTPGIPVPPIGPIPPIALPSFDQVQRLVLFILRWIRENLGESFSQPIFDAICNEFCER